MNKLTGTEKQIAWAKKIKSAAIADVEAMIADQMAKCNYTGDKKAQAIALTSNIVATLKDQNDPDFWIGNRNENDYASYLMGRVSIVTETAGSKQPAVNWYKIGHALMVTNK